MYREDRTQNLDPERTSYTRVDDTSLLRSIQWKKFVQEKTCARKHVRRTGFLGKSIYRSFLFKFLERVSWVFVIGLSTDIKNQQEIRPKTDYICGRLRFEIRVNSCY